MNTTDEQLTFNWYNQVPPVTSLPDSPLERKKLGAWYTPIDLVRPLVQWAIRSACDKVLDPSVGDGFFLLEAAKRLHTLRGTAATQIFGTDISSDAVLVTRNSLKRSGVPIRAGNLIHSDFFNLESPMTSGAELPQMDTIIGNPPYIRYQAFPALSRARAMKRVVAAGGNMTRLSSAWAPFVIHSTSFLKLGGRLAFVLPEEFVYTSYAADVREFLRTNYRRVSVLQFENHIFPESQERIVLLLAEGKGESPAGEVQLARVSSPESIRSIDECFKNADVFPPRREPLKWEANFDDSASRLVTRLAAAGHLVPLKTIGKAGIGYVSGANDYFVMSPSEAQRRDFPTEALVPTIISAKQLTNALFTKKDWRALASKDDSCLLWTGSSSAHRAVKDYIREGEERRIAKGYKCSRRNPWFVVPGATVPHAIMTYMSDVVPRFALNTAEATCSNNFLAINLDGIPVTQRSAFAVAFYNSATMLSAEMCGRRYGGGVLKLEPSEADRVLVPSPTLINRFPNLQGALTTVERLLRERKVVEALDFVDSTVLGRLLGLNHQDISRIQRSRRRRYDLRVGGKMNSLEKNSPPIFDMAS